jgi:colanic acid/amylovoran biosynthesis protein
MTIFVIGQCTIHWGRMEFGNIGNYYIAEPLFRELHRVFPEATIKTTFVGRRAKLDFWSEQN